MENIWRDQIKAAKLFTPGARNGEMLETDNQTFEMLEIENQEENLKARG